MPSIGSRKPASLGTTRTCRLSKPRKRNIRLTDTWVCSEKIDRALAPLTGAEFPLSRGNDRSHIAERAPAQKDPSGAVRESRLLGQPFDHRAFHCLRASAREPVPGEGIVDRSKEVAQCADEISRTGHECQEAGVSLMGLGGENGVAQLGKNRTTVTGLLGHGLAKHSVQGLCVRRLPHFSVRYPLPMRQAELQHLLPEGAQLFVVQVDRWRFHALSQISIMMVPMRRTARVLPWFAAFLLPGQPSPQEFPEKAEFHFVRLEYTDGAWARRGWGGRGWWMQDWPEAEMHFAQGIQRITRIHIGDNRHMPLSDNRIYDSSLDLRHANRLLGSERRRNSPPWATISSAAVSSLSTISTARAIGKSFSRQWRACCQAGPSLISRTRTQLLRVLFDIKERTFIPGLRHLRPRRQRGTARLAAHLARDS